MNDKAIAWSEHFGGCVTVQIINKRLNFPKEKSTHHYVNQMQIYNFPSILLIYGFLWKAHLKAPID